MKILISGASGYVGSSLVKWLTQHAVECGVITRRMPNYLKNLIIDSPVYIASLDKWENLKTKETFDILIHLASANEIDSLHTEKALRVTAFGARQAINLCKTNRIPKIVFFSTFHVYGMTQGNISEETPIHCRNDYALTHFFGEEYIRMAHTLEEIEYLIFRPTNIFGAPISAKVDRWQPVPFCFCKEAVNTGTITLHSSGKQVRDFISMDDVSNLTYLFCEQFSSWKNQTINLSSGQVHTIREIAEMTANEYYEITGKQCQINILSDEPVKNSSLFIETNKLQVLPYFCKDTMKTEIRKTFELLGLKNGPN
jgi:UDP-glucose 4-epimerase